MSSHDEQDFSLQVPIEGGDRTSRHSASSATLRQNELKVDEEVEYTRPSHDEGNDIDLEKQATRQANQQSTQSKPSEEQDPNIVDWNGPNDPEKPSNYSRPLRWMLTVMLGLMTFTITFASSVFSTTTEVTSIKFGVSTEVMTLGTSLFVLGLAFGPIVWGPFSELFGRKYPLFFGFFGFVIFQIPVAVAQNLQTVMICRFLGGFFGSSPLAIMGGVLVDLWPDSMDRGVAMCLFAGATFVGPAAGPIMGSFITKSYLGWRWTAYITLIMGAFFGGIAWIALPETFGPVILSRRAKKLRYQTRNWAVRAKFDERQIDLNAITHVYLIKPFVMFIKEPILMLMTLYMSLIYGMLYLFFEAFPISFQEERHWLVGVGSLPFLTILIGVAVGCILTAYLTKVRFARSLKLRGHIPPEERLVPMLIGSVILPPALFWFAWTSNPHINYWPQLISGVPIGAGLVMIFLQGLNYIVDVYLMHANSGLAANTFFRSWVGAGFPLFAVPMYHNLGVAWATSLLAFLTLALAPVPFLFYRYGSKIRQMSRFSPT